MRAEKHGPEDEAKMLRQEFDDAEPFDESCSTGEEEIRLSP